MSKILKKFQATILLILMLFSVSFNVLNYEYKVYAATWYPMSGLEGQPGLKVIGNDGSEQSIPSSLQIDIGNAKTDGTIGQLLINDNSNNYSYTVSTLSPEIIYYEKINETTFNIKLTSNAKNYVLDNYENNLTISQFRNTLGSSAGDPIAYYRDGNIKLINNIESNVNVTLTEHWEYDADNNVTQTSNMRFSREGYALLNISTGNYRDVEYEISSDNSNIISVVPQSYNVYRLNPGTNAYNNSNAVITVKVKNKVGVELFSKNYIVTIYEEKTSEKPELMSTNGKIKLILAPEMIDETTGGTYLTRAQWLVFLNRYEGYYNSLVSLTGNYDPIQDMRITIYYNGLHNKSIK